MHNVTLWLYYHVDTKCGSTRQKRYGYTTECGHMDAALTGASPVLVKGLPYPDRIQTSNLIGVQHQLAGLGLDLTVNHRIGISS